MYIVSCHISQQTPSMKESVMLLCGCQALHARSGNEASWNAMGHVKEYYMESMYIWSGHQTISHQIAHQIHKDVLELSEVHGQSVS